MGFFERINTTLDETEPALKVGADSQAFDQVKLV